MDKLLAQNMHEVLQSNDQLTWCMQQKLVLQSGFVEPPLHFKPTYKFDVDSDVYDSGKKKRIPAWTDRILYVAKPLKSTKDETNRNEIGNGNGSGIECISYNADFSLRTSDHRPVYSTFVVDVDICIDYSKLINKLLKETHITNQMVVTDNVTTEIGIGTGAAGIINSTENIPDQVSEKIEYNNNIQFSSESQVCIIS